MRVLLSAVCLICWLVALAVFQHWRKATSEARRASDWPSVPATVVRSEARHVLAWHEPDTEPVYLWEWSLAYKYRWEGKEHTSERFSFSDPVRARSESKLAALLARFSVGASTAARVNPESPEQAVLTQDVLPNLLFLALFLAAAGLAAGFLPTWLTP